MILLAGDVGGTKTNLAVFASKDKLRTPLFEAKLPSAHYPSLTALVKDFLSNVKSSVDCAVFGVAGPVANGKTKITNLPWIMQEEQLQEELDIPLVHLLNDLEAMANAIPLLGPTDLYTVNPGRPVPHAPIAVIAPGTGLGEAFLTWDGTRYRTYPSEGGHADFAPRNPFEVGLLVYMLERLQHVSYEHICSGIGLPNIYAYLKESGTFEEPAWLAEQLVKVEDHTPIIINAALSEQDLSGICVATLETFTSILGAEAGNMALKILATGGIYLGGGISPRILSFLESGDFIKAFKDKGRFSHLLASIPVQVILNPKVGLIGAAAHGFDL
ncbi:MAG TPA: glucokinase [Ktedonobacteraceae bacterium]|jgi:glucokinase